MKQPSLMSQCTEFTVKCSLMQVCLYNWYQLAGQWVPVLVLSVQYLTLHTLLSLVIKLCIVPVFTKQLFLLCSCVHCSIIHHKIVTTYVYRKAGTTGTYWHLQNCKQGKLNYNRFQCQYSLSKCCVTAMLLILTV